MKGKLSLQVCKHTLHIHYTLHTTHIHTTHTLHTHLYTHYTHNIHTTVQYTRYTFTHTHIYIYIICIYTGASDTATVTFQTDEYGATDVTTTLYIHTNLPPPNR